MGFGVESCFKKKKMRNHTPAFGGTSFDRCVDLAPDPARAPAILAVWAMAAAGLAAHRRRRAVGFKNHFYPMLRYLGAALAHGELPLWNPYHFGGHPSVADPQSLLFTPTMLLFGWLVPEPSMQLFDLVVFAHFLPGALAFVSSVPPAGLASGRRRGGGHDLHARRLGDGPPPAYRHHLQLRLFPLALLLLEEALDRRSYRVRRAFRAGRGPHGRRPRPGGVPLRPDMIAAAASPRLDRARSGCVYLRSEPGLLHDGLSARRC